MGRKMSDGDEMVYVRITINREIGLTLTRQEFRDLTGIKATHVRQSIEQGGLCDDVEESDVKSDFYAHMEKHGDVEEDEITIYEISEEY